MARRRAGRGPIQAAAVLIMLLLLAATPASAQGGDASPPDAPPPDSGGGGGGDAPAPTPEPPPPSDPPQPPPPPPPPPPAAANLTSCDQLPTLPGTPRDRCAYFRAHCADADEGAAFPYAGGYWCGAALIPFAPLRWLYVLLVLLCLPFLFALLGDTAERYFSPIMACVSQSIPKMRPRFAGVTFVALGNGAPDLSANASAIRSGEYLLAAGAITGGAMFVQCVVGAQVIAIASARGGGVNGGGRRGGGNGGGGGGVRCAGAMMRDAGVFSVAAASLALALLSGRIGRGYVAWSVALYVLYVAWVFAGDEWHAAGRPDTEQVRQSLLSLRERVAAAAAGGGNGGGNGFGGPAPGRRRPPLDDAGIDDEPALLLPASAAAAAADAPWASADDGGGAGSVVPPPPGLGLAAAASAPSPSPPQPLAPAPRRVHSHQSHHHHNHNHGGYVDPLTYRQLVWADLAEDDGGEGRAIEASLARREQRRRERRRQRRQQREAAAQQQGGGGLREMGVRRHGAAAGAEEEDDDEEDDDFFEEGAGGGGAYEPAKADGAGEAAEGLSPRHQRLVRGGGRGLSSQQQHHHHQHGGTTTAAAAAADADFPPTSPAALRRLLFGADAPPPLTTPPPGPPSASSSSSSFLPAHLLLWLPPDWSARLYARARRAATHGASDEWDDPAVPSSAAQRAFRALTLPMLLSTYLAQRATIPLADPGPGYSRGWLLLSVVGFPLWMTAYTGLASGGGGGGGAAGAGAPAGAGLLPPRWWVWLVALATGLLASRGLAAYTAGSPGTPPALPLPSSSSSAGGRDEEGEGDDVEGLLLAGGDGRGAGATAASSSSASSLASSAPALAPPSPPGPPWLRRAVPAALALAGFAAGVTWIDAVASQAVAILSLAATLARLPQGVVGLTLLAWGNSLGDYFGNAALARAGAGSTAITACFAGPLFNVLISMALGFGGRFAKLGRQAAAAAAAAGGAGGAAGADPSSPPPPRTDSVPVQLTPEVALGCGCLVLYSATAVAVGRACGGRLPPWFATVARAFYGVYFCAAVAWGMSSSSLSSKAAASSSGLFL